MCQSVAGGLRRHSLGWGEDILKELLDLVDVSFDLAVEGDEGGVCARGQVLEVGWLPGREMKRMLVDLRKGNKSNHATNKI